MYLSRIHYLMRETKLAEIAISSSYISLTPKSPPVPVIFINVQISSVPAIFVNAQIPTSSSYLHERSKRRV